MKISCFRDKLYRNRWLFKDVKYKKDELERKMKLYKRMARSFWERCQWELKERKDPMREKMLACQNRSSMMINASQAKMLVNNINRTSLHDQKFKVNAMCLVKVHSVL